MLVSILKAVVLDRTRSLSLTVLKHILELKGHEAFNFVV